MYRVHFETSEAKRQGSYAQGSYASHTRPPCNISILGSSSSYFELPAPTYQTFKIASSELSFKSLSANFSQSRIYPEIPVLQLNP